MTKLTSLSAILLLSTIPACVSPTTDGSHDETGVTSVAEAPLLGVDAGQDGADRDCHVVLRDLARVPGEGGGYETNCIEGSSCYYVWEGVLDVSSEAVALGAEPVVLFQSGSDLTWWQVDAESMDSPAGQHLYRVRLDEHTVADGMSLTALMQTVIQVVPALEMPDGSRLFDHNRNPGDFDNYVLNANNSWSIEDDAAVCSRTTQQSEIHFRSDWSNVQQGALVAGGKVMIDYDLLRLPQCIGSTYNGSPSWSTTAYARFFPSGDMVSGPVSEYAYSEGVGFQVVPVGWDLEIPTGAESVELWFAVGGMSCNVHWDSNYGQNFSFPVLSAPVQAAIGWAGDGGAVVSRGVCESVITDGIPASIELDSWALTRADCLWIDIDVWAPGITDQNTQHPEWLEAQAMISRDGAVASTTWLDFVGRVGNNYRYRWNMWDGNDFIYTPWDQIQYAFQFSVDGNEWFEATQTGGSWFVLQRGDDWCPETYWGSYCTE